LAAITDQRDDDQYNGCTQEKNRKDANKDGRIAISHTASNEFTVKVVVLLEWLRLSRYK
jgi:hypothetical protein